MVNAMAPPCDDACKQNVATLRSLHARASEAARQADKVDRAASDLHYAAVEGPRKYDKAAGAAVREHAAAQADQLAAPASQTLTLLEPAIAALDQIGVHSENTDVLASAYRDQIAEAESRVSANDDAAALDDRKATFDQELATAMARASSGTLDWVYFGLISLYVIRYAMRGDYSLQTLYPLAFVIVLPFVVKYVAQAATGASPLHAIVAAHRDAQ